MQETFYATFAGLSFTLLGLWWVVVQLRHKAVTSDPAMRRSAFNITLYFALPGIMSLLSLMSAEATFIWRSVFLIAGVFGLIEGVRAIRSAPAEAPPGARLGQWIGVVLFALVCVVAALPGLVASLGIPLTPIQTEGLMLSAILFLGITMAWQHFAEPVPDA